MKKIILYLVFGCFFINNTYADLSLETKNKYNLQIENVVNNFDKSLSNKTLNEQLEKYSAIQYKVENALTKKLSEKNKYVLETLNNKIKRNILKINLKIKNSQTQNITKEIKNDTIAQFDTSHITDDLFDTPNSNKTTDENIFIDPNIYLYEIKDKVKMFINVENDLSTSYDLWYKIKYTKIVWLNSSDEVKKYKNLLSSNSSKLSDEVLLFNYLNKEYYITVWWYNTVTDKDSLLLFDEKNDWFDDNTRKQYLKQIEDLTKNIIAWENTEDWKILKIYSWITNNIKYDYDKFNADINWLEKTISMKQSDTWIWTFANKKWVCWWISRLFIYMLNSAWINKTDYLIWYHLNSTLYNWKLIAHAWVKIWDYYYDPTFWLWQGEYKYFKLPKDLFYADRIDLYDDKYKSYKDLSTNELLNIISKNYLNLTEKYKNNNYLLLNKYINLKSIWINDYIQNLWYLNEWLTNFSSNFSNEVYYNWTNLNFTSYLWNKRIFYSENRVYKINPKIENKSNLNNYGESQYLLTWLYSKYWMEFIHELYSVAKNNKDYNEEQLITTAVARFDSTKPDFDTLFKNFVNEVYEISKTEFN